MSRTQTVHLPIELIEIIDARRGPVPRNRYASELLAAALGVQVTARRPGRPLKVTDPSDEHIAHINRIGRDDDAYRIAWSRRLVAAHDALEAIGATMDESTRMRLVREQWAAFPSYHPLASLPAEWH